ncbi:MAG: hypothetical protein KDK66_04515 [Deltaproteobacteria bacterium]|nr:hypothetical protein [Deltaproteobacteria bacterium]
MLKLWLKIKIYLPWLLRVGLFLAIPYSVYVSDYLFIFGAITALVISLLPAYWRRSRHASLPFDLELLVSLALFVHIILGEIFRFYDDKWYFDKIMHFYGTAIIALLAFLTVFTLHWSKKIKLSLPLMAYFTVIFSMAVGAFWEIGEFVIDQVFGRNTQYSLENTMWDLIFNFVGGSIAAIFAVLYTRRKNQQQLGELLGPVRKILELQEDQGSLPKGHL